MDIGPGDALVVVDVQNDFVSGGALPVPDGRLVVPVINDLQPRFQHLVVTRDWHPADHCSFAEPPEFKDGSWPSHCVQDTPGAEFVAGLNVPADALVVSKGIDPDREAYSGFEGTDLAGQLRARGVGRLFMCGLATDYCVKATALDARKHGFDVVVLLDGCRGIDQPTDSHCWALDEMREAGCTLGQSKALGS